MEQKLNRVIRSCLELGENNPITSIHDQGAGGNGMNFNLFIVLSTKNQKIDIDWTFFDF